MRVLYRMWNQPGLQLNRMNEDRMTESAAALIPRPRDFALEPAGAVPNVEPARAAAKPYERRSNDRVSACADPATAGFRAGALRVLPECGTSGVFLTSAAPSTPLSS